MKLTRKFHEMWGLTFEGGEERTYDILEEIEALEKENEELKEKIHRLLNPTKKKEFKTGADWMGD